jgi:nucleotide-binding universal stress UspA family protein
VAGRLRDRVAVETEAARGVPGQEIIAAGARRAADLIALAPRAHPGLGRWLYGDTTEHVLRHASAPVLLVPETCTHTWEAPGAGAPPSEGAAEGPRRRVLVPLDGSEAALAALDPAGAGNLAAALAAEVLLLHVVAPGPSWPPFGSRGGGSGGAADDPAAARGQLEDSVVVLRDRGLSAQSLLESGPPAPTIARVAAEQGVDAIAMATHGRTGLARLVMGSVADETLRRSPVPVLLVRPALAGLPATA